MKLQAFYVQLGREELVVLLKMLHVPTLPGLGENPLDGLTEDQMDIALLTAERALRARGILRSEAENRVALDPVAFALLGTCILPEISILVQSQTMDGHNTVRYYHATSKLSVEHSFPQVGLNSFVGFAELKPMLPRMFEMLHVDTDKIPTCSPGKLRRSSLEQAKKYARANDSSRVDDVLRETGMPAKIRNGFRDSLMRPSRSSSVVRIIYGGDFAHRKEAEVSGFALIQSAGNTWLLTLETDKAGEQLTSVQPVTGSEIKERLKTLAESAKSNADR
ncbi:hypothetical protein [Petrachloros mirabilis]